MCVSIHKEWLLVDLLTVQTVNRNVTQKRWRVLLDFRKIRPFIGFFKTFGRHIGFEFQNLDYGFVFSDPKNLEVPRWNLSIQ